MPDLTKYLDLGATAIVAVFAFYFMWQSSRNRNQNGTNKEVLRQVTLMNENHLNSICEEMKKGNDAVVNAITEMNRTLGDKIDNLNAGISRLIGRGDLK